MLIHHPMGNKRNIAFDKIVNKYFVPLKENINKSSNVSEALNEKVITVITWNNKNNTYTNKDIQEMIDDIDTYYDADNLPGWLLRQRMVKNKKQLLDLLHKILSSEKDVNINVQSDKPQLNSITF